MEREDIRMLKPGEDPNFPHESQLAGLRVGIRVQNLERELAIVPRVLCKVDGREGTLTDLPSDFISSGEGGPERADRGCSR